MRRRTSADGDLSSRNARTVRRSSSCSSLKAKFTACSLVLCGCRFARQPQYPLPDDVLLDLGRARVDGLGPAQEEARLGLLELVRLTRQDLGPRSHELHLQLAQVAMPVRPVQLADRRLRRRAAGRQQLGDRAEAVVLHDLYADP